MSYKLLLLTVRPHFISLTTDNASVNDVIVATAARCLLARYGIPFTEDMHIRCIAHVINLVVQAFLHAIDEAVDPEVEDWYELNKDEPIYYDISKDPDQIELEDEEIPKGDKGGIVIEGDGDIEDDDAEVLDAEEIESIEEVGSKGAVTRVRPSNFYYLILILKFDTVHLSYASLSQKLYHLPSVVCNSRRLPKRSMVGRNLRPILRLSCQSGISELDGITLML